METIVIQNRRTGLFVIGEYDWTSDQLAARHFARVEDALAYCVAHRVVHADIIRHDTATSETVIPGPREDDLEHAA